MILEQDENSKKVTGYQLAYIIFETMRILTKYCIIREITNKHSEITCT